MYPRLFAISVFFGCVSCSDFTSPPTASEIQAEAILPDPAVFRTGVTVYSTPDTNINLNLLAERDGYATTFTDPYGYLWTISVAYGLTDQDFAAVGSYLSDETPDGHAFYYGKIRNWEVSPDCVVYLSVGNEYFVTLRRNQDQGPCPLGAGYKTWLPEATPPASDSAIQVAWLWAYGANNHPENIVYGEFEGVAIYGNDPYGQTCGDFQLPSNCMTYADNLFTGHKWTSSEFVNRFMVTNYNHRSLLHSRPKTGTNTSLAIP